jgi:hypothetical protein
VADNPYLGEYEAYSAQAKTAYQSAMAKITQQRAGYLTGYGLGADGQPVADAPFGAYQQMMGQNAQSAEEADAAGRSMGFSGGLSRQAMQAAQRMTEGRTLQFGQDFQQGLSQFSEAEEGAGTDYNNQLYQKMMEITQRAASDRAYSPADYSGVDYEDYGDSSPDPASAGLPWQPPKKNPPKHKGKKGRR